MVERRRRLHDAVTEADALRALRRGGEEHLGRAGVAVLLEEVVLDLPHVVDAQPIGELALLERVLDQRVLGVFLPRPRELVLVEDPELHAGRPRRARAARVAVRARRRRRSGLDLGELLGGEHRPQRRDRHLDLVERRLTRGQPLQRAGRASSSTRTHAPVHVPGREADDLVADAGDERDQDDPGRGSAAPSRDGPTNEYTTIVMTITVSRKLVPQRTCCVSNCCADSGGELDVVLVGGDRLVLGAVVLEDALDVLQLADQQEVAEEDARGAARPRRRGTRSRRGRRRCRCRWPRHAGSTMKIAVKNVSATPIVQPIAFEEICSSSGIWRLADHVSALKPSAIDSARAMTPRTSGIFDQLLGPGGRVVGRRSRSRPRACAPRPPRCARRAS